MTLLVKTLLMEILLRLKITMNQVKTKNMVLGILTDLLLDAQQYVFCLFLSTLNKG